MLFHTYYGMSYDCAPEFDYYCLLYHQLLLHSETTVQGEPFAYWPCPTTNHQYPGAVNGFGTACPICGNGAARRASDPGLCRNERCSSEESGSTPRILLASRRTHIYHTSENKQPSPQQPPPSPLLHRQPDLPTRPAGMCHRTQDPIVAAVVVVGTGTTWFISSRVFLTTCS